MQPEQGLGGVTIARDGLGGRRQQFDLRFFRQSRAQAGRQVAHLGRIDGDALVEPLVELVGAVGWLAPGGYLAAQGVGSKVKQVDKVLWFGHDCCGFTQFQSA